MDRLSSLGHSRVCASIRYDVVTSVALRWEASARPCEFSMIVDAHPHEKEPWFHDRIEAQSVIADGRSEMGDGRSWSFAGSVSMGEL